MKRKGARRTKGLKGIFSFCNELMAFSVPVESVERL